MALSDNIVAYYKLDETTGSTAFDEINDEDMTNTGITVNADGKIGKSYYGDAEGDLLENTSCTAITGNWSINCWLYRTASPTSSDNVVAQQGTYASNSGFAIWIDSNNYLGYRVNQDYNNYKSAAVVALNTWVMATIVYNGSTMKIYVDGTEEYSGSYTTDPSTSTTRQLFTRDPPASGNYIGRIDEIGFWSKALTSTEVTDLYNSGDGLAYPFTSNVTVFPSAVAFSMTAQVPNYFIDVTQGPVSFNMGVLNPDIEIPSVFYPGTVAFTMGILTPTFGEVLPNGTISVGSGTIGSQYIATRYPVEEGLTAGYTKQIGDPNLRATEEGTW